MCWIRSYLYAVTSDVFGRGVKSPAVQWLWCNTSMLSPSDLSPLCKMHIPSLGTASSPQQPITAICGNVRDP